MNEEYALCAAVIAEPDDDQPRLVLADWLEERGDFRTEYIRLQVGMFDPESGWLDCPACGAPLATSIPPPRWSCRGLPCSLWRLENDMRMRICHPLMESMFGPTIDPFVPLSMGVRPGTIDQGSYHVTFIRGLPEIIGCPAHAFDPEWFRTSPIREVRFTDAPANTVTWGCEGESLSNPSADLPEPIYRLLEGGDRSFPGRRRYASNKLALAALSRAVVAYARSAVGLPPISVRRRYQ